MDITKMERSHKHKWIATQYSGCRKHSNSTKHKYSSAYIRLMNGINKNAKKTYMCQPLKVQKECVKCHKYIERIATNKERENFCNYMEEKDNQIKELFSVRKEFMSKFKSQNNGEWKYGKIKLSRLVNNWAKKQNPNRVQIINCFDHYGATSDLLMIHQICSDKKNKTKWNGTNVIIPQCDKRGPSEFILRPENVKDLIKSLSKVCKIERYG